MKFEETITRLKSEDRIDIGGCQNYGPFLGP